MALKKVGALWVKLDKKNRSFLSGVIDLEISGNHPIFIFKNKKQNENSPDYIIQIHKSQSSTPNSYTGQDLPDLDDILF